MKNILVLLCLFLTLNCFGQFEIDTTIKVNESMEDYMPSISDADLYFRVETYYSTGKVKTREFIKKWNGEKLNWVLHFEYDERGNEIKYSNTDTLNNLVRAVVCSAPIIKRKFNKKNELVEESFHRTEEIATFHDCNHYHKEIIEYDNKGQVELNQYIEADGTVMTTLGYKYDDKGQVIEIRYLDENRGLLTSIPSVLRVKYDKEGREIENRYLTHEEKGIFEKDKMSHQTFEYVDDGKIITIYDGQNNILKKVKQSGSQVVTIEENIDN